MQTVKFTLLALLFGCLLAACGHKGPLYLPKGDPAAKPETTQDSKTKGQKVKKKEEADSPS